MDRSSAKCRLTGSVAMLVFRMLCPLISALTVGCSAGTRSMTPIALSQSRVGPAVRAARLVEQLKSTDRAAQVIAVDLLFEMGKPYAPNFTIVERDGQVQIFCFLAGLHYAEHPVTGDFREEPRMTATIDWNYGVMLYQSSWSPSVPFEHQSLYDKKRNLLYDCVFGNKDSVVLEMIYHLSWDQNPGSRAIESRMLIALTGKDFGYDATQPLDRRRPAVDRWFAWWAEVSAPKVLNDYRETCRRAAAGKTEEFRARICRTQWNFPGFDAKVPAIEKWHAQNLEVRLKNVQGIGACVEARPRGGGADSWRTLWLWHDDGTWKLVGLNNWPQ